MMLIRRNIWLLVTALMVVLCTSGCSLIYDDEVDGKEWDGDLSLVLRVSVLDADGGQSARSFAGRADDDYSFELPEIPTEQLQSLRVIIVNTKDNKIEHNYYLQLQQPANSFDDLKFKVDFSSTYNVYLVGNEMGMGSNITEVLQGLHPDATYTAGTLEALKFDAERAGVPLIDNTYRNRTIIPMTEMFVVNTIARPTTGPQTQVVDQREDLFLTRSLSKFSFNFYRSADYEGTSEDVIKAVKITGLGKEQYVWPNNTVYDPAKGTVSTNPYKGRVITAFDVPEGNTVGEHVFDLDYMGLVEQLPVFGTPTLPVSYHPQLYFTESLGMSGADKFQCSISYDGVNFLPPVTMPNLPSLPRNTHVIVNIIIGNHNAMLLTVTVLPWVPVYNEFDFTHNIAMAQDGALTFQPGTYASLNSQTGRLVLGEYPMAAVGTFGISEPKGATWTASLVTTAGELNALQFQVTDAQGNTSTTPTLTGTIDGQKTTIRVVPTMSPGAVQRAAQLQVVVTFADGLSVPLSITRSTESGSEATADAITFIQNPQQ